MKNNKQRLFEVMKKVNPDFKPKLNEELAVASDGGYYDKPEHGVTVTSQEAAEIKQITDAMYEDLFGIDGVTSVGIHDDLKQEIINGLKQSGIRMEYDSDQNPNVDFYWIGSGEDMELAKEEFKSIVSNLYNKVQDEPIDEISTGRGMGLATQANQATHVAYNSSDPILGRKKELQANRFQNYINPELQKVINPTYQTRDESVEGFSIYKADNGTTILGVNPNPSQTDVRQTDKILISIKPDSYSITNGDASLIPQSKLPKVMNFVKLIQADLNGAKTKVNPAAPAPQPELAEAAQGINPKYTHFAVTKDTNQIVNGWDYSGIEPVELRQFKKDYFFEDLTNMGIDPHNIKVVTAKYLQTSGTNPFDMANWNQSTNENVVAENRDGFKRMIVFWMYDKEGGYLGDLDPMNDEGYISNFDEIAATPEFEKFAKEKNITRDQIGRVTKSREYMMNGEYLEKQYYAPSDSEELFDSKTNTWYNLSGQQMRDPSEYDRGGEGYTPFGDEG